jgi:hypothetical protein
MYNPKFLLLLLVIALQLLSACMVYQLSPISIHRIQALSKQNLDFYLVDGGNTLNNVWLMKHPSFKKKGITCTLTKLKPEIAKSVVLVQSKKDAVDSRKNVYLFVNTEFAATLNPSDSLHNFDYHQLERMHCVELNTNKSITNSVGLILIIAMRFGGFLL